MQKNSVKQDEQIKKIVKKEMLKRLFSYMKPYKKQIIQTLVLTVFIVFVDIMNPYFLKIGIDVFIKNSNLKGLLFLGAIAAIINFISMKCFKKRIQIMLKAANEILMTIRQELYCHIQKLSFNFFDNRPAGKILARIIGDVNSLKDLFVKSVIDLLPNLFKMLAVLIIMIIMDVKLALISMIMLPFLVIGMILIEIVGHKRWQVFRKKNSNLNAYVHENFSGIKIVQSFTAEEKTHKSFINLLNEHKKAFIKAVVLSDLFWPMVQLSWGVGTVIVFAYGVNKLAAGGDISIGTLIAFTTYIGMFWAPVEQLSNFYNILVTNMAGAERIFEILDVEPDIIDGKNAGKMPKIKGDVTLENVCFEYEKGTPVLKNINLKVKKGETIALVGPTGAGKSTIVSLIARFYDLTSGKLMIDNVDIQSVTIESLREQMGIMTQDTFLFSGTIRDNITYGKLDASDEEIINAAKAVHAHDFIMKLDKGYDTNVNERGSKLSVGQRQLIAFARTMLSNPKILILDEATSSIDTHTERLVQKGIEKLLEGRTSFVIAHRLSTIEKADRIIVVDEGIIKEAGTHEELLKKRGEYYNLYTAQTKSMSA